MRRALIVAALCWSGLALAQTEESADGDTSIDESAATSEEGGDPPLEPDPEILPDTGSVAEGANDSGRSYGVLGPLRIGPTVALGFPHPLNYGVDLMYEDWIGVAFSTGKFGQKVDSTEVELANWDFRVRYHPWAGSFFMGAAYGQQELLGKAESDLELKSGSLTLTIPTTLQIQVDTTYLTPHIGWFSVWDSGFTMGFELGVQLALSSETDFQVAFKNVGTAQEKAVKDSDDYKELEKSVKDVGDLIGDATLPYLTLLRLGWMF